MFRFIITVKSHKDLPIRFVEFGSIHRYEPSGTMHGLMRVEDLLKMMGIYSAEDQIENETKVLLNCYQRYIAI